MSSIILDTTLDIILDKELKICYINISDNERITEGVSIMITINELSKKHQVPYQLLRMECQFLSVHLNGRKMGNTWVVVEEDFHNWLQDYQRTHPGIIDYIEKKTKAQEKSNHPLRA